MSKTLSSMDLQTKYALRNMVANALSADNPMAEEIARQTELYFLYGDAYAAWEEMVNEEIKRRTSP